VRTFFKKNVNLISKHWPLSICLLPNECYIWL